MQTKKCTKCGEEKEVIEYDRAKFGLYGFSAECKLCKSVRAKKYAEKNKEKISAYRKKYKKENKKKIAERDRKYYIENREKILEYSKKYVKENKEIFRAYQRKYWSDRKDFSRAHAAKRRARKVGNGGNFTPKEWQALCKKYDYKCLCCRKEKKLVADHVIPVSWPGGHSNISNIQTLCRSCNARKGNRHATDYR